MIDNSIELILVDVGEKEQADKTQVVKRVQDASTCVKASSLREPVNRTFAHDLESILFRLGLYAKAALHWVQNSAY